MTKNSRLIQDCILIIFLILCSNDVHALRLRTKTNQVESNQDKSDELGGSLFDDLTSPDEIQSEALNSEDREIEGKESVNDDDLFGDGSGVNDNNQQINTNKMKEKDEEEINRLAQEEEATRLAQEEQAKRLAEEEQAKQLAAEEEAKRLAKEEQAKRLAEEEQAKRLAEEEQAKRLAEEEKKKEKEQEDIPIPKDLTPLEKIHHPFQEEKSTKTRIHTLLTLITFGSCYLIFRIIYNLSKNTNKFISKGISSLSNQIMFLFICYITTLIFYIYGTFDSIPINWEYLLSGISLFIISWFIYNTCLLFISLFILNKWKHLDSESTSFNDLRHQYDRIQNQNYQNGNNSPSSTAKTTSLIEQFEFLVLKRFFFIPLFPLFKPSSLLKQMHFSVYLEKCLLMKLRHFFKFSWTCWILAITVMMFWNVFIVTGSVLFVTIFSMLIPLLGLAILLVIHIYQKHVYRKVVQPITEHNMSNFQDIEYNSNSALLSQGHPVYLLNLIQNENKMNALNKKTISLHEHIHLRPPSLYENTLICGASGFAFMFNIIQTCSMLFIAWLIILYIKHYFYIRTVYSKLTVLLFMIPCSIVYFVLYVYLTAIVLKWNAVVSSIEMNRSEKNVKKLMHYHIKRASRISEEIFLIFKRIYYDMKLNTKQNQFSFEDVNEMKLGFPHLQELIRMSVCRYTGKANDSGEINIKDDLIPYMKSLGNTLNAKEIEFMFHLISDFDAVEQKGKLNVSNLYDICGAVLHFRTKRPCDVFKFVFDTFYQNNPQYYKDTKMSFQNMEVFIDKYKEFFNNEQVEFIKEQCLYFGNSFSFDSIVNSFVSFRQYCPY